MEKKYAYFSPFYPLDYMTIRLVLFSGSQFRGHCCGHFLNLSLYMSLILFFFSFPRFFKHKKIKTYFFYHILLVFTLVERRKENEKTLDCCVRFFFFLLH
jgi:hypothetical protein